MKKKLVALITLATLGLFTVATADVVFVTSNTSNCTSTTVCGNAKNAAVNINGEDVFSEIGGAFTGAPCNLPDKPANANGARYYSLTFSNAWVNQQGITLRPTLGVTGGVYKVYHVFSSTANNVSTTVILGVTNDAGCTLSFDETDRFQRAYGQPAPQQWQLLGFLTNNVDTSTPTISLYWKSGQINSGTANRLVVDTFRFQLYEPCTDVPVVGVTGPLSADANEVVVTGVSNAATKVTVYQNSGSGFQQIGELTTGIVGGNNTVTVAGLVKGARVAATQTLDGQEGCAPTGGILVGGGANPRIRLALSIRENPTATGPVGANGGTGATSSIHFIPATSTYPGSCPGDGTITLYPSNEWQTVSVNLGRQSIGNAENVSGTTGTAVDFNGYPAANTVAIQVYAYKTVGATKIYSPVGAASPTVTSNDTFTVTWNWDAVPGADGYRLLRNWNEAGFTASADVVSSNSFFDTAFYPTEWTEGEITVTPTTAQTTPSMMWNPAVSNSIIAGEWAFIESIAFASDDVTDNGPYDIYIDNLANGTNGIFQDFEGFAADTPAGVVFNQPSFSGTTSANILSAPNIASISGAAADTGSKSIRVRWQFVDGANNRWLRFNTFNTSVMPNPLVNLNEPISFRILLLPVGSTPVPPLGPVTVTGLVGTSLNYTGGGGSQFVLVKSADINAPINSWTRVDTNMVTPGSFTIPVGSETQAFYRVKSE